MEAMSMPILMHSKLCSNARRSLQGALLAKKVPEDTPIKMIQWALSNKLLGQKQLSLATTVTFFGGKGTHPQKVILNLVGELEATQDSWLLKTINCPLSIL